MEPTVAMPGSAEALSFETFRQEVLQDYRTSFLSRQMSLTGRREVLTGKAKFGIFGDGKEVPQVALAKFFQPGDWRSGYYRDQTWLMALGLANVENIFSQLYADPDINNDPWSGGRQMNAHFTTRNINPKGEWLPLADQYNTSTDMAPTAAQMPRSLGLALASKLFRNIPSLKELEHLSRGSEVCFCSIGDASTSEGHFWETVNAACVMQVPLAIFVWDDGYGISVPTELQTAKGSISKALAGFQEQGGQNGLNIYEVKAWDYAGMCETFEAGIAQVRRTQTPALFHVQEVTQPQGHSTSGSHERYKTPDRLAWEKEWDCVKKFREWILTNELADNEELSALEVDAKVEVRDAKTRAWQNFIEPLQQQSKRALAALDAALPSAGANQAVLSQAIAELRGDKDALRRQIVRALNIGADLSTGEAQQQLQAMLDAAKKENERLFNSHLHNEGPGSALAVQPINASYGHEPEMLNGYEIINRYFDQLFETNPLVVAFGEDVGRIGDVNQGFAGLQQKHGEHRIFDTGIREATIMGEGIGLALRGLRPIAEIQYIDYLLYGLQPLSDDVASLQYRTVGQQVCPLIVRTRGHRLEGIWHSGSPMGMIINSLRGMHVCVPRNMVQAAGMYNTLLKSLDPAIVIECLNGYRLKEQLPLNLAHFTVPLGVPEVLSEGSDITVVSYGSTLRIIQEAMQRLQPQGISVELIDVQTLLPFDIHHNILNSLKKTGRILFVDEDVPGGAAAYMSNHVMEEQGGYRWLDAAPRTLTAKAHRPAYGSDGDYFSKPNAEDVVAMIRLVIAE